MQIVRYILFAAIKWHTLKLRSICGDHVMAVVDPCLTITRF
jgi:hypothetical protein